MTTPRAWTTPADVQRVLLRRWQRGDLLAAVAKGHPAVPQSVPITGPGPRHIAADFARVQDWVHTWEQAPTGMRVEFGAVGGRLVGTNRIPVKAWVDDEAALWRLLGVVGEVAAWRRIAAATDADHPKLSRWVRDNPARVVAAQPVWGRAVATVAWLEEHGHPGVQLRHIDVPGIDTKFVETHRALIAVLLDEVLPAERIDADRPRTDLAGRYRLAVKPAYLRLRRLDGGPVIPDCTATGFAPSELTLRAADLARAAVPGHTVIIVENEITYLALPPLPEVVAIFGGGYAASRLGVVGWLAERRVLYWGDIDTHGFAILDGVRAAVPHVRSVLMDQATFLQHQAHWGHEPTPYRGVPTRLEAAEQALYDDLVEGRHGEGVRLEQERVRFGRAVASLTDAVGADGRQGRGDWPVDN